MAMQRPTPRNNRLRLESFAAARHYVPRLPLCPLAGFSAAIAHFDARRSRRRRQQLEKTLVDVIARAEPSVVAIGRSPQQQLAVTERRFGDVFGELRDNAAGPSAPLTVGAGVIIDRTGLVLTQYLAVHEGDQHTVTTIDRTTYPATIRAADPRSGLAVLAIDAKASPLQTGGCPAKTRRHR